MKFVPAKTVHQIARVENTEMGLVANIMHMVSMPNSAQTLEQENAFARRLVAAHNATRHVPVETLETDPLTLDGVENTFNRLKAQNAQLIQALEKIKRWEMPETGKFWDKEKTEPMSYAACYGSNGERDIVRFIASSAIAAATITEKTETP